MGDGTGFYCRSDGPPEDGAGEQYWTVYRRQMVPVSGGEVRAIRLNLVGLEQMVDQMRRLLHQVTNEEGDDDKPT